MTLFSIYDEILSHRLSLNFFSSFSENRFQVLDYATRKMTQVEEPHDTDLNVEHMFSLVLLENSDGKTKEFLMAGNSE